MVKQPQSIAVVGAGIAGATVAHELERAGYAVHVFDKSRGPGSRLATRRVEWVDRHERTATTQPDHGAVGFGASSAAFRTFADLALQAACFGRWTPRLAAGSEPMAHGASVYLPAPYMPAPCRLTVSLLSRFFG